MRTRATGTASSAVTFTQLKRRDQLVECAIDAIVDTGYSRTSVAEVARRAGVSKGVVTYHFPAKDDLIQAVIASVIAEMSVYLEPRFRAAEPTQYPERFVAAYLTAWTGYIQTHRRDVIALVRIYDTFRDEAGRPDPAFDVRAIDIDLVARILRLGQEAGRLGSFDSPIVATVMKAALDDLMRQYADNSELDVEAHGAQLIAIFEAATRPDHGPAAHPVAVSQQATARHPEDLTAPREEK